MEQAKKAISAGLMIVVLVTAASCTRTAGDSNKDATVYRHQVQEGETLDSVARQYYLDPAEAERIGEFNMVTDDELTVGMTLRVPMTSKEIARLKLREQARVPYNEGLVLAEKGAYIDAIQKFKTALDVDSDFADAHYNVGVSLQMMKSYDKATDSFKKAIRRDPTNVDYEFALGNCYFYQQSYQSAAGAFERTIEADPSHVKAHYSLAVCYEKLKRWEDAKRTWHRYLELDPKSVWATEARKRLDELE